MQLLVSQLFEGLKLLRWNTASFFANRILTTKLLGTICTC